MSKLRLFALVTLSALLVATHAAAQSPIRVLNRSNGKYTVKMWVYPWDRVHFNGSSYCQETKVHDKDFVIYPVDGCGAYGNVSLWIEVRVNGSYFGFVQDGWALRYPPRGFKPIEWGSTVVIEEGTVWHD